MAQVLALIAMFVVIIAIEFCNHFIELFSHNNKLYHRGSVLQTTPGVL